MSFKDWISRAKDLRSGGQNSEQSSPKPQTPQDLPLNAHVPDFSGAFPRPLAVDTDKFGTDPVSPFTKERIVSLFLDEGIKYSYDDEGDLFGIWDGHAFFFLFMGPDSGFFQIRGRWKRSVSHPNRTVLLQALNDWNREKIWPKAFLREDEDGTTNSVFGEITCDFTDGVTETQLNHAFYYSMDRILQFFKHLSQTTGPEISDEPFE